MPNMGKGPWPVASPIVESRIADKHMRIHNERVAATTAIVDSSEPKYMHHLDYDAKKAEVRAEKQFEIEAENARLFQRLAKIEDEDSTKIIRPSTSRSTVLSKPGMYHSEVGGQQCVDHINLTATISPASIHYQPLTARGSSAAGSPLQPSSRAGSRPGSRAASRAGSAHASPMRASSILTSGGTPGGTPGGPDSAVRGSSAGYGTPGRQSAGGSPWTGKLVRRSMSQEALAASLAAASGALAAAQLSPDPVQQQQGSPGAEGSVQGGELSVSASMASLPPILPGGAPPRPPVPRSRGPSPARTGGHSGVADSSTGSPLASASGGPLGLPPKGRPGALLAASGESLGSRSNSPARLVQSADAPLPPQPPPARAPSPSRLITASAPSAQLLHASTPPRPPSGPPHGTPSSRGPSPLRASQVSVSGSVSVAESVSGRSLTGGMSSSSVGTGMLRPSSRPGSRGPSPLRSSIAASFAASAAPGELVPSTGDWRTDHEIRKQQLASTYLSGSNLALGPGKSLKAVRRSSPMGSRTSSRTNLLELFGSEATGSACDTPPYPPSARISAAGSTIVAAAPQGTAQSASQGPGAEAGEAGVEGLTGQGMGVPVARVAGEAAGGAVLLRPVSGNGAAAGGGAAARRYSQEASLDVSADL